MEGALLQFYGSRLLLRVILGKRPKVMETFKHRAGLLHCPYVQLVLYPPHISLAECRPAPTDLVDVSARNRMMSGMELRLRLYQFHYVDIGRKHIVDLHLQYVRRKHCWCFEVGHLIECMYTGIGSARPHELKISVAKCIRNGSYELSLYRTRILLYLPAGIARTFVFDRKLESCHA